MSSRQQREWQCCAQGPTGVPSTIISFAQKTYVQGTLTSKLHVIELGAGPGLPFRLLMPDAGAKVLSCICPQAHCSARVYGCSGLAPAYRDTMSCTARARLRNQRPGQGWWRLTPTLFHAGAAPVKRQAELFFPPEFADDFPVAMQISERYGLVYVITKLGLLFVYDLTSASAVYRNRISPDPIFLTANSDSTGGFYAINKCGPLPAASAWLWDAGSSKVAAVL